jgi:hypothetical protein
VKDHNPWRILAGIIWGKLMDMSAVYGTALWAIFEEFIFCVTNYWLWS